MADLEKIGVVHLRLPLPSDPDQLDSWVNTWRVGGSQGVVVMEVTFEKLALEHCVLWHNVASKWTHWQGLTYVEACDLFCGTICHPSLTKLCFVLAPTVYINTKHMQIRAPADNTLSYSDDVKALINKRRFLVEHFPEEEHIMVIMSNKHAQQPGSKPHTAATLLCMPTTGRGGTNKGATSIDPWTCIITATDASLAWAMSPTFAHFLVVDKAGKE